MTDYEKAKEVLKREPVRAMTGEYSGGRLSVVVLIQLIAEKYAVTYTENGRTYVKAA